MRAARPIRPFPLVILSLVVLLASCRGGLRYPRSLTLADSLTECCPDSALRYLDRLRPAMDGAGEADRMYYRLLCVKAADKAYIPHTSDSLIRPVLDYYEQGGDARLLPVARYYAGRVSMDLGDAPQAIEYFLRAVEALPADSCSTFRGILLHQIGRLYWDQHVNDAALSYYQEALKNNVCISDTTGMLFDMEAIAGVYEDKDMPDSSLTYYHSALRYSESAHNEVAKAGICTQLGRFYITTNQLNTARPYVQYSLSHIDADNLNAVYGVATKYYMATHQTDSAIYYCQLQLSRPNVYAKEGACRKLADIYIGQNNPKEANRYIQLYKLYHDSVKARHAAEDVARVNALYNQHANEQKILHLRLQEAKHQKWLIIIVSALVLSIFAAFLMIRAYRRKIKSAREKEESIKSVLSNMRMESQEMMRDNMHRIEELNTQIHELQSQNEHLSNSSSQYLNQLSELESELKKLDSYVKVAQVARRRQEDLSSIIRETEIYRHLFTLSKEGRHPTKADWNQLETAVLQFFPSFKQEIQKFVKLSEFEYLVCLLVKATFTPSQMSVLTMKSKESITSTRRRLYEKAFHEKGKPADWDQFLLYIVH